MFGETFFYIIGIYAFLWWFIDNFKSLFFILWNLFVSYIQPDKNPPIAEKFGSWAGKSSKPTALVLEFEKKVKKYVHNSQKNSMKERKSPNLKVNKKEKKYSKN